MEVAEAVVRDAEQLAPSLVALAIDCPSFARTVRTGQFLMVRCGDGLDPFLPRPFSVAGLKTAASGQPLMWLIVEPAGAGSRWLASRRAGDPVTITGPLGRPLQLQPGARHLLLIGEGTHVAPLLYVADEAVERGLNVTFLQVRGSGPVFPAARLPTEVEVVPAETTAVPSALGEHLRWADQIVAAGGEHLLRQLSGELKRRISRCPTQAFVRGPAPCGTGICRSCVVETRRGPRLLCRDGLWFELHELY